MSQEHLQIDQIFTFRQRRNILNIAVCNDQILQLRKILDPFAVPQGHVAHIHGNDIRAIFQIVHLPVIDMATGNHWGKIIGIRPNLYPANADLPHEVHILMALVQRVHGLIVQAAAAHNHLLQLGKIGQQGFNPARIIYRIIGNVNLFRIRPHPFRAEGGLPQNLAAREGIAQSRHLPVRQSGVQHFGLLQLGQARQQPPGRRCAQWPAIQIQNLRFFIQGYQPVLPVEIQFHLGKAPVQCLHRLRLRNPVYSHNPLQLRQAGQGPIQRRQVDGFQPQLLGVLVVGLAIQQDSITKIAFRQGFHQLRQHFQIRAAGAVHRFQGRKQ